jgi:acetyl esterase/lipase
MTTPDPLASFAALFNDAAVDAKTAAFNAQVAAMLATLPPYDKLTPQVIRDARESGQSLAGPVVLSPMAVERTVPGPAGPVPVRVFVPPTVRGVYLHLHGGGWVLGRAHHYDQANEALARSCELAVVSVDYRLAPEHPFPAGPDDCEAAAQWLLENAQREFATQRLLIGGESAGAHLSALTLLRLRDRHGATGFAGANLVYGSYDLTMTPSQRLWGERNLVLSTPIIRWFLDHFVPVERRADPAVSPLQARLHGLPPALFTVGTLDPLLDDSLFMYSRWLAAGNQAELAVYPGGIHGFDLFPHPVAPRALAHAQAFLRQLLSAPETPARP